MLKKARTLFASIAIILLITTSICWGSRKKFILKPFMIVAGDHAKNDMAGTEADSWKSILTQEGYEPHPVLKGLGSNVEFAWIFLAHIADAAKAHNIQLK